MGRRRGWANTGRDLQQWCSSLIQKDGRVLFPKPGSLQNLPSAEVCWPQPEAERRPVLLFWWASRGNLCVHRYKDSVQREFRYAMRQNQHFVEINLLPPLAGKHELVNIATNHHFITSSALKKSLTRQTVQFPKSAKPACWAFDFLSALPPSQYTIML